MGATLSRERGIVAVAGGIVLLVGLAIGGKYVVDLHLSKKRRDYALSQMKLIGHVISLQIYPIKSCRSIVVKEAECSSLGLFQGKNRDRIFVITDRKYHFITARQESSLLLIQPSYHGTELWLDAPGRETFKLLIPSNNNGKVKVRIWGQNTRGIDCGNEVAQWLETALNRPSKSTRLIYYPWQSADRIPKDWQSWDLFTPKDSTIFGDLCPYMMINEASVKELNSRLANPITAQYFRPSILFQGNQAYEEDDWKYVKIGDSAVFRNVRLCSRCVLTTIDPETGVRSPEGEPLTTLKKYRLATGELMKKVKEPSPLFGIYLGLEIKGNIKVGDPVYASV